jgi:hypothetical protein
MTCRALLLLGLLGAAAAIEDKPQQSLAKLMKLGYGLSQKAKKSVDAHAFGTGELIGRRLKADQAKFFYPSPEGRLNAAREGLKDSVHGGVSLLEQGVDEARAVAETQDVIDAAENVRLSVVENPQSKAVSDQSEQMIEKVSDFMKGSTEAAVASLPKDAPLKTPFLLFQKAFARGEKEAADKLKKARAKDPEAKLDTLVQGHLNELQSKAKDLIQSAGKVGTLGLDSSAEGITVQTLDGSDTGASISLPLNPFLDPSEGETRL